MCIDMTPGLTHSYYLTRRQRVIELAWPLQPKKLSAGLKTRLLHLLHGGPLPGSPELSVDPEAFDAAVKTLDKQDVELAISTFTGLGYEVTVRTLR
jgi:hypothetical protein